MSDELDAMIRKGKNLETEIKQLTAELSRLRQAVAAQMGEAPEYYGARVVAKKWARVRWSINKDLLLDELPREAIDYFKEAVFIKEKIDQAVKAGHLPPRLRDRAIQREQEGWNVSLKVLDSPAIEPGWELEEEGA